MPASRKLTLALAVPALLLALVQLVPYGRAHTNPPDGALVAFDSPGTERLAQRACFDCHSHRTNWPWYAWIAPLSWRIQSHVDEGRAALNFTAFDAAREEMAEAAGEAGETVAEGEMPPADYLLAHPEARLTPAEKRALAAGLDRTFAGFTEGAERTGRDRSGEGPRARRGGGREPGEERVEERGEAGD
jgi:hypothetical protein